LLVLLEYGSPRLLLCQMLERSVQLIIFEGAKDVVLLSKELARGSRNGRYIERKLVDIQLVVLSN